MPSIGEVGSVTEHPVAAPRDDMRCSRHDTQGAPGAQVGLERLLGRNRLHVPQPVTSNLRATPPGKKVIQVTGFVVVSRLLGFAASGSITARHGSSLKCGYSAEKQAQLGTQAD